MKNLNYGFISIYIMTKTIFGKKLLMLATITVLVTGLTLAATFNDAEAKGGNKIKASGTITEVCFNAAQVATGGVDCFRTPPPLTTTFGPIFLDHLDKGKWKVEADPTKDTAKIKLDFKTTDGNKVKIKSIPSTHVDWTYPVLTISEVEFTITSNPPGKDTPPISGTNLCGQVIVNKMTGTMEFDIASVPGCGPNSGTAFFFLHDNASGTVKKFKAPS